MSNPAYRIRWFVELITSEEVYRFPVLNPLFTALKLVPPFVLL
jgi:hypothetical protein